ncbi:MAG: hypothetical protein RLZ95_1720 [Bacteroidota bacterium]|jgi:hypothetical protein
MLLLLFIVGSTSLMAQNETEAVVQNLQTANFNNLLTFWDNQVEVNMPDLVGQKQYSAKDANELLKSFFNKNSILGFEKSAARKVGTTVYLTGKLISNTTKFNLTMLLQQNKADFVIISVRVN